MSFTKEKNYTPRNIITNSNNEYNQLSPVLHKTFDNSTFKNEEPAQYMEQEAYDYEQKN